MGKAREIPRAETSHPLIRQIRADRSLLKRIEDDTQIDQDDPSIVELKRIIRRRITQLLSELRGETTPSDAASQANRLQLTYNCLFLIQ